MRRRIPKAGAALLIGWAIFPQSVSAQLVHNPHAVVAYEGVWEDWDYKGYLRMFGERFSYINREVTVRGRIEIDGNRFVFHAERVTLGEAAGPSGRDSDWLPEVFLLIAAGQIPE